MLDLDESKKILENYFTTVTSKDFCRFFENPSLFYFNKYSKALQPYKGYLKAVNLIEKACKLESKELDLSGLQLIILPPSIHKISDLENLNLSGNFILYVSLEITNLTSLLRLDLHGNLILPSRRKN